MIRFTENGIFADTEKERQEFYKQMDAGSPVIMAHLELWRKELEVVDSVESDIELTGGE